MRKLALLLIALVMPLLTLAQTQGDYSGHPPNVLVIGREDVKPGKAIAHEKSETAWTRAFYQAKWPTNFLAMTSLSGPTQVWFCQGYDSFDAMEKDSKASDASAPLTAALNQYQPPESGFLDSGRQTVATLSADISYHADFNLAEMRYFRVRTTRVRFGHDEEYIALRKMLNVALERSGWKQSSVTFHVLDGAPAGTYLTFYPSKSLAEYDGGALNLREVLGGDFDKFMALVDKSVAGYDDNIFQFSNKMSYMPRLVAADKWWAPKTAPAAAAAVPAKKDASGK